MLFLCMIRNLLEGISPEEFFSDYFEKNILHLSANRSEIYRKILTPLQIDELLSSNQLQYPKINIVKSGEKDIPLSEWTIKTDKNKTQSLVNYDEVFKKLHDGYTLILNGIHHYISSASEFCFQLSKETHLKCGANVYITPANNGGFGLHYDWHDVFVLQLMGEKNWVIQDKVDFLPDEIHPFKKQNEIASLNLKEGELLYIPRGFPHLAATSDKPSIHITVSMQGIRWHEFLGKFFKAEPFFRQTIPNSFTSKKEKEEKTEMLKSELQRISNQINWEQRFNETAENFLLQINHHHKGRFIDWLGINDLDENSMVKLRGNIIFSVKEDTRFINILMSNKIIDFPVFLKESIHSILKTDKPVGVKEIKGNMPVTAKMELIKRLLKEGLLELV